MPSDPDEWNFTAKYPMINCFDGHIQKSGELFNREESIQCLFFILPIHTGGLLLSFRTWGRSAVWWWELPVLFLNFFVNLPRYHPRFWGQPSYPARKFPRWSVSRGNHR